MPTAIITGASRGLGLALARALDADGWRLVLDARGAADLERAARDLSGTVAVAGDVADPRHRAARQRRALVRRARRRRRHHRGACAGERRGAGRGGRRLRRLDEPGGRRRAGLWTVDGLLTGWHEPEASHLRLLEAAAGEPLLSRSYAAALAHGYLWHEFGDSQLVLP